MHALSPPPTHFTAKFPSREFYPTPPLNFSHSPRRASWRRVRVREPACLSCSHSLSRFVLYTPPGFFCFVIHKMLQNGVAPSIYLPITRAPRASSSPFHPYFVGTTANGSKSGMRARQKRKKKPFFFISSLLHLSCTAPYPAAAATTSPATLNRTLNISPVTRRTYNTPAPHYSIDK